MLFPSRHLVIASCLPTDPSACACACHRLARRGRPSLAAELSLGEVEVERPGLVRGGLDHLHGLFAWGGRDRREWAQSARRGEGEGARGRDACGGVALACEGRGDGWT